MVSILGISAFHHDSAACLLVDGEIVAAAQEEPSDSWLVEVARILEVFDP